MNAVLYYSCSGQSKYVAETLGEKLQFKVFDLSATDFDFNEDFMTAAVVFPVHCQGLAKPFKKILGRIKAENFALIATYGRAGYGNALFEAAKLLSAPVIAGAYLPAKHTYRENDTFVPVVPNELIQAIKLCRTVTIPKLKKTPFSSFLPELRSRLAIKIKRTDDCDGCNTCATLCPVKAMQKGKPNGKCIRCLKCVCNCPKSAYNVKRSAILKRYLLNHLTETTLLYTTKAEP